MGITGTTRLCFILGRPIGHTLSPTMHNAAFAALALPYVYLPWAVPPEGLGAAAAAFRAMENFAGANVTVPHKEAIRVHLDALSPEAEGTAEITVANRSPERAEALVGTLSARFRRCQFLALPLQAPGVVEAVKSADVLINATSVGLAPGEVLPLDLGGLRPTTLVCDLIYRPLETAFLEAARGKGCRVLNGLGMLLHQGAAAFRLFTGMDPPLDAMRAALARGLAGP